MRRTIRGRRKFLRDTAILVGTASIPYFVPRSAFGANDRIVTGYFGVGRRGVHNLLKFAEKGVVVKAICDVDAAHTAGAYVDLKDSKWSDMLSPAFYLSLDEERTVRGWDKSFTRISSWDAAFRRILDDKDIDAVVVSTPDHWHAYLTVEACKAGKHVYCEAPLSLTIEEGRKIVEAQRRYNRMIQVGSENRSDSTGRIRVACELARERIGKIKSILIGVRAPAHSMDPKQRENPMPSAPEKKHQPDRKDLDYEAWLGPAGPAIHDHEYDPKHVHSNFRYYWDFAGGEVTSSGVHFVDIVQWAIDFDNTGPISVKGTGTFDDQRWYDGIKSRRGWYDVTKSCRATLRYKDGVEMTIGQGQDDIPVGATFIGEDGAILVSWQVGDDKVQSKKEIVQRIASESLNKEFNKLKLLAKTNLNPRENEAEFVEKRMISKSKRLEPVYDHIQNFLDAIQGKAKPICDAEAGHRAATICHLANCVILNGREIQWDSTKEQVVGGMLTEKAARLIDRPSQPQWKLTV